MKLLAQQPAVTSSARSAAATQSQRKPPSTTTTTPTATATFVSNEQLWRQSIQHKHAQRRRNQHLFGQQQQHLQLQLQQQQQHGGSTATPPPVVAVALVPDKQPPAVSSASSTYAARALTKAIGAAADAGQLLLLLSSAQQQLDAIHVSAAVNQCARGLILDLQPPQLGVVSAAGEPQQNSLHQQEAAAVEWLWSLDDAAVQQGVQLWLADQQQHHQQQHQSADWLLLLTLCGLVQQHAASMSSKQLCTCLTGLAQLLQQHMHVPLLVAPTFQAACQALLLSAHSQMQGLDRRGLSLVLHAAAGMACSRGGFSPSPEFMLCWYRASRRQLAQFSPLDLAMCAGALGRMQKFPPAEWMADFWRCSQVGGVVWRGWGVFTTAECTELLDSL